MSFEFEISLESLVKPRQRIGTDDPTELRRPVAASLAANKMFY